MSSISAMILMYTSMIGLNSTKGEC